MCPSTPPESCAAVPASAVRVQPGVRRRGRLPFLVLDPQDFILASSFKLSAIGFRRCPPQTLLSCLESPQKAPLSTTVSTFAKEPDAVPSQRKAILLVFSCTLLGAAAQ